MIRNHIIGKCIDARHQIHQHAELSNHEVWTKQFLIDFLKVNTALEIHDQGKWFYAVYKSGQNIPGILFRAEMDAIPVQETCDVPYLSLSPGVGHKCGHDGHCASLLATAMTIDDQGAACDVYLLFQHAEETGDGAPECVEVLKDNNINEIYGYHNNPGAPLGMALVKKEGTLHCASKGMIIHFEGRPSHAATPEMGINPAFAIACLIKDISKLTNPADYRGLTMCTVIEINVGTRAFGTQASSGEFCLTIRGEHEDDLEKLQTRIENEVCKLAKEEGLKFDISYCDIFPVTVTDPKCSEIVEKACEQLNVPFRHITEPERGSDDFGWYTSRIPGTLFFLGDGENHAELHSSDFDFPDNLIEESSDLFMKIIEEHCSASKA